MGKYGVSDTSKMQYITTYINLINKSGSENMDEIFKYIKTAPVKDNTKFSYLNAIISLKNIRPDLVKDDIKKLVEYRNRLQIEIEKQKEKNNANSKQTEVMTKVNLKKLHDLADELYTYRDSSVKALEDYLLVRLMVQYPLRNDLQEIKITKDKSDLNKPINCIYIPKTTTKAILSIPEYKTSKSHGAIVIELDQDLTKDIKKLIEDGREYLFVTNMGEPYTSSNFTHRLNRVFEKHLNEKLSSTLIRKIYLTGKYGETLKDMKNDAQLLGHNLETQQSTYISNNKKILKRQ